MAEVAIPRQMFQEILRLIAELRPQRHPPPRETPIVTQEHPTGGVRLNASENSQINPSTIVRAAQGDGSRPNLASVLREGGESANIHVRSGAICWGIPANIERKGRKPCERTSSSRRRTG
jgi:hypothetical protein